jgi:hypothetical protein
MYERWYGDKLWVMVPAQAVVGQFLQTFKDFPQRQKSATVNIQQVLDGKCGGRATDALCVRNTSIGLFPNCSAAKPMRSLSVYRSDGLSSYRPALLTFFEIRATARQEETSCNISLVRRPGAGEPELRAELSCRRRHEFHDQDREVERHYQLFPHPAHAHKGSLPRMQLPPNSTLPRLPASITSSFGNP